MELWVRNMGEFIAFSLVPEGFSFFPSLNVVLGPQSKNFSSFPPKEKRTFAWHERRFQYMSII